MRAFCLAIEKKVSTEEAEELLAAEGFEILFSTEDETLGSECYVKYQEGMAQDAFKQFPFVSDSRLIELGESDWERQWEEHAPNFYDGLVHLSLGDKTLLLKPGPGFGDLSHPTTRLVLEMMGDEVKDRVVVDIGSGSGILAIAAKLYGAAKVYGVEIDPAAIAHAGENAELNGLKGQVQFMLPNELKLPDKELVILMNMIQTEQEQALTELKILEGRHGLALISGILNEQKEDYLRFAAKIGLKIQTEKQLDKWLGLKARF